MIEPLAFGEPFFPIRIIDEAIIFELSWHLQICRKVLQRSDSDRLYLTFASSNADLHSAISVQSNAGTLFLGRLHRTAGHLLRVRFL